MHYIDRKLDLPTDEQGRYRLTKEATGIIKRAEQLVARFDSTDKNRCFFRASIRKKVEGAMVCISYDMPINVSGVDKKEGLFFCAELSCYKGQKGIHPITALVKAGKVLSFEPVANALTNDHLRTHGLSGQAVYCRIDISPAKTIRCLFDCYIGPADSSHFIVMPKTTML